MACQIAAWRIALIPRPARLPIKRDCKAARLWLKRSRPAKLAHPCRPLRESAPCRPKVSARALAKGDRADVQDEVGVDLEVAAVALAAAVSMLQ